MTTNDKYTTNYIYLKDCNSYRKQKTRKTILPTLQLIMCKSCTRHDDIVVTVKEVYPCVNKCPTTVAREPGLIFFFNSSSY